MSGCAELDRSSFVHELCELGRRFVKMYVSELTKDMGDSGEKALHELFARAEKAGVVDKAPEFELIR